jgi:hypothetical protein
MFNCSQHQNEFFPDHELYALTPSGRIDLDGCLLHIIAIFKVVTREGSKRSIERAKLRRQKENSKEKDIEE